MKRLPFVLMELEKREYPMVRNDFETYEKALSFLEKFQKYWANYHKDSKTIKIGDIDNGGFVVKKFDSVKNDFCEVSRYYIDELDEEAQKLRDDATFA